MSYQFVTDCVHSTAEAIDAMTEQAHPVTWRTFTAHVSVRLLAEMFPVYAWQPQAKGLRMPNDYAVSFYRSKYQGRPCYYLEHSCIEYIFCERGEIEQ